jgi:FkbM family methyltransferase
MGKVARMALKKIGQKISRIGDVIQQPRLLSLRLRGVDVRLFESLNKLWLLNSDIQTILDIGANTGQFARAIHELLPGAFIYSFEPLVDCFRELQRNMCRVKSFKAFNVALDERQGEALFYRSEWSPSSSLRPMGSLHKENFPYTAGESTECISVKRLDDYIDELELKDNLLVKIDVQGCEDKVIAGGQGLLQRAKILIVETSIVPLYEGQPLFRDILTTLESQRFLYKGSLSQLTSPIDSSILQSDAIFIRQS